MGPASQMGTGLQVFELGGDVVSPQLANNLMKLIAEGAGEDDEQADTELRAQAVRSYLDLLEKPHLSPVLLKVHPTAFAQTEKLKEQFCLLLLKISHMTDF